MIDQVLAEDLPVLFNIGPVQEVKLPPMQPHDFNTFFCAECGEVTVERYARVKNGRIVCIPCAEKL
ncbi:MAG: TraR/DksA C4-type zinc finger protein [Anaerolineae bacterium]